MMPSIELRDDAQRHRHGPFRGVSSVEIHARNDSPRERALAETENPRWRDLSRDRLYEPPTPTSLVWRGLLWLTRLVAGLLLLPTLFLCAVVMGGFAGSLLGLQFFNAYVFAALAYFLFHLLAGLLRWTVQAPVG